MSIAEVLEKILSEYDANKTQDLAANALAGFIRRTAANTVSTALGDAASGTEVVGSPGQGNWAAVPWISVFDTTVTDAATRGYYVVYLFDTSAGLVHLSLNQGTTAVRREFGSRTHDVLSDRAAIMRERLPDFQVSLPALHINLGTAGLPGDYSAGHALGVSYQREAMPDEAELRRDLLNIVRAYRSLTFRGGLDLDTQTSDDEVANEFRLPASTTLTEMRRYRQHRRIERNRKAPRLARQVHGLRCQTCDMSFSERYGALGADFIEAHHLKPISELLEHTPVEYNVATDFAVLCSNCHRMIHRQPDSSDLVALRQAIALASNKE